MRRGVHPHLLVPALLASALLSRPAGAHGIADAADTGSAPLWFVLLVGGAVVAGSFLFATLLTDHEAIRTINELRVPIPVPSRAVEAGAAALSVFGVLSLAVVVVVGLAGPADARSNLAVLLVFGVWWAGYTMSVYLVGNTWPSLNPWRALSRALPRRSDRTLQDYGDWPAALGLLGLFWLEVVSPVGEDPRLLAAVVVAYTAVTLTGASLYGDAWFDRVDPLTRVFDCFGRLAPVARADAGPASDASGSRERGATEGTAELRSDGAAADSHPDGASSDGQFDGGPTWSARWTSSDERSESDGGLALRLPGSAAADWRSNGDVGPPLVVALLWGTTFDGLVSTPGWAAVVGPLVDVGVPAAPLYLLGLLGGFALFVTAYRTAARWSRETADSTLSVDYIARWFVPALLPIAAGYHVAHFLGFLLRLSPPLSAALRAPLNPPETALLGLPDWYGSLQLLFVLGGHVFAIWIAHGLSFDLFPGRLQPIRSQYPFTAVMVLYTMTSMWIVAQPHATPPGV